MHRDKKKLDVLIVEDNDGDFRLVKDYLSDIFINITIERVSTFQGLRVILAEGKKFDIILLDLTLEDYQGGELINETKEIINGTPLIVLTGYSDFSFAVKSLALGVADYLLKDELNENILYKSIIYSMERNKNLLKLIESEQRYSDIFHLNPIPMWVFDLSTTKFLDMNDAAIEHYGYTKEEFLSMSIRDIRPKEDQDILEKTLNDSNIQVGLVKMGVFRHRKKNGEIISVEIRSNFIEFKGTKGVIVLANDVTDRLKYVNAIELQNEKLREIAWIQSHLVRAPLSRILGLISFISDKDAKYEDKLEMMRHLETSANELDSIIRDIINKAQAIKDEV